MSQPLMATLKIDDQEWDVLSWGDLGKLIPESKNLGFETESRDTSNYSGRVDHLIVDNNKLYIHKIEVNLIKEYRDFVPKIGHRDDIETSYWVERYDSDNRKGKYILKTDQTSFLYFDDLFLNFTGEIVLGRKLKDLNARQFGTVDEYENIMKYRFVDGVVECD